jgi:hypothetical protein
MKQDGCVGMHRHLLHPRHVCAAIAFTGALYGYFAGPSCGLNRFFSSLNPALVILITSLSIHPTIQEHNPRSGLPQSAMVSAYCMY